MSQCTHSTIVVQNVTYQPGKSDRTHDLTELCEWRSLRFPQRPHNFPEYQRGTLTVSIVTPISISNSDSMPASLFKMTVSSDLSWFTPDDRDTPDGKTWGSDTECPSTCGIKQWVKTNRYCQCISVCGRQNPSSGVTVYLHSSILYGKRRPMQEDLKHSDKPGRAAITRSMIRYHAEPLCTRLVTEGHQTIR